MAIRFDGQVAIVTGAGRGIGREYALDLARRGASVVVNDLGAAVGGEGGDAGPAQQVVDEIIAAGGKAVANTDSVATADGGFNLVKTAIDAYGRADIVIHNAGILRDRAFQNITEEDWNAVFAVHVGGAYNVLKAAWPTMRQQQYGRVVLATSNSGYFGNFGQANYGAAKTALIGLMNVLKLEGAKYNIKVNCIGPSAYTRMTAPFMSEDRAATMGPEHVAPAVTYLCSTQCEDSGLVIEAGAGFYRRVALVRTPGVEFDPTEHKDGDWVAENWSNIVRFTEPQEMWDMWTPVSRDG